MKFKPVRIEEKPAMKMANAAATTWVSRNCVLSGV
jgi:hypothetical protein